MVEDLGPQVVDQALADAGAEPALRQPDAALDHGQQGDAEGQADDQPGPLPGDAVVDDRAVQQGGRCARHGVDHDQAHEQADLATVRAGEGQDAARRAGGQLVVGDCGIL